MLIATIGMRPGTAGAAECARRRPGSPAGPSCGSASFGWGP